jgi:hypothetical protein
LWLWIPGSPFHGAPERRWFETRPFHVTLPPGGDEKESLMRFGLFGSATARRGGPDVDSGLGYKQLTFDCNDISRARRNTKYCTADPGS